MANRIKLHIGDQIKYIDNNDKSWGVYKVCCGSMETFELRLVNSSNGQYISNFFANEDTLYNLQINNNCEIKIINRNISKLMQYING